MKNKKKKSPLEQKILIIVSCILLVVLLFSASFFMVLSDRSFYDKSFDKYGVYKDIGVIGVRNTVDSLINYLTSENTEISKVEGLKAFSSEEQAHLEDVHRIIRAVKIMSIAFAVILAFIIIRLSMLKDFKISLQRIIFYGGVSALAVLLIIFLLSLNFSSFFEGFHKLLFPQGNYSFPSSYLLIKLFPEAFFRDFARKMFFHTAVLSLILIFLGSSPALAFHKPRRH